MENYVNRLTIKNWAEDDRPREKLLLKGKNALSDAELLAILLGSGNVDETAVDLAKKILGDVRENLIELSRMNVRDLEKFKGIGKAKAVVVIAALELGKRRNEAVVIAKEKVTGSRDAYEIFRFAIGDQPYEKF